MKLKLMSAILRATATVAAGQSLAVVETQEHLGRDWPRAEIRPEFQRAETGGKSGHGALTLRADGREGLHGWGELSGDYQAPPGATRARIALPLLWAPKGNHEEI